MQVRIEGMLFALLREGSMWGPHLQFWECGSHSHSTQMGQCWGLGKSYRDLQFWSHQGLGLSWTCSCPFTCFPSSLLTLLILDKMPYVEIFT